MGISFSTRLHTSFENAVQRTRQTLAVQGFGVLTEIDVQATLRSRAGVDIEEYLILGACNPQFAHQAIDVNRQVGLLLPCNVVVRGDPDAPGTVIVDAVDPRPLIEAAEQPGLRQIAEKVSVLLQKAVDSLDATVTAA
jgi:uncharacterized protein (DUF302 family)